MRNDEAGATLIGWVAILAVLGLFALAAMRLIPIYSQKLEVYSVLTSMHEEFDGQNASPQALRKALKTKFQVKDVDIIDHSDIEVTPVKGGTELRAYYEHKTPFVFDVGLYVTVDHKVLIRR